MQKPARATRDLFGDLTDQEPRSPRLFSSGFLCVARAPLHSEKLRSDGIGNCRSSNHLQVDPAVSQTSILGAATLCKQRLPQSAGHCEILKDSF